MNTHVWKSPAKINLGLRVLGKRPDGYHNIESLFIAVDVYDHISITASETLHVSCSPAVTSTPEENLVYKAASLFSTSAGLKNFGAKIRVTKQIPTGSGLGGGSSNAATTLIALNSLHNNIFSEQELSSLASQIGSDVPFFMCGGVALVCGRGEVVRPLDLELPWSIVLVIPPIHISTHEAYRRLQLSTDHTPPAYQLQDIVHELVHQHPQHERDFFKIHQGTLINDFHHIAEELHSEIGTITKRLIQSGAVYASLSGSGSAVFGLFVSEKTAHQAASALGDFRTYICRPLNRRNPV